MPGLFVSFEGGEGSGKSTQVARLAARLRSLGHDPLVTREPGGTPVGEGIRALLLDHERRPTALTEALLMVASRAQLAATVLRPALEAGRIVLCDRYGDSTLAYQGGGRGLDGAMLAAWNRAATDGLAPALTVLFDLPTAVGLDRRHAAAGATNRLDREPAEFHERVRRRYLELAAAEPERWVVLDGSVGTDDLEDRVWQVIGPRLAHARS
jgi:dTMP kinase